MSLPENICIWKNTVCYAASMQNTLPDIPCRKYKERWSQQKTSEHLLCGIQAHRGDKENGLISGKSAIDKRMDGHPATQIAVSLTYVRDFFEYV